MIKRSLIGLFAGPMLLAAAAPAHAQFPPKAEAIAAFSEVKRGLQDVIRSASQNNSQGASSPLIDSQTAQGMSYDNQIKATNTYFQKRQLNRMYRQAEHGPRSTAADHQRWSKEKSPDRLTSNQLDPYGGRLNWPVVLRQEEYNEQREAIDALYLQHTASGGGINTQEYAAIQTNCQQLEAKLQSNVKTINAEQYTYARKFLQSLKYEARYPVGS